MSDTWLGLPLILLICSSVAGANSLKQSLLVFVHYDISAVMPIRKFDNINTITAENDICVKSMLYITIIPIIKYYPNSFHGSCFALQFGVAITASTGVGEAFIPSSTRSLVQRK